MKTLVVCEKPSAALKIATALDDNNDPKIYREQNVPYFVAKQGDKTIVVVTALGHLYTITQSKGKWTYPIYEIKWVPAYKVNKKKANTKAFIDVISKLSKNVTNHVSACDNDIEGSLIAYMILRSICKPKELKKAKRMKFSTLTEIDIKNAWNKATDIDLPVIMAGKARHEVDWLFGINLSRALTLSVRNNSEIRKNLSIGRVQGPTLSYLKDREIEIQNHIPIPYFSIKARIRIANKTFPLEYHTTQIDTKLKSDKILLDCKGKEGTIKIVNSKHAIQSPPPPFNLSDLQQEAFRKNRLSPKRTKAIAEKLYLEALISYPRTSSQHLPTSLDLRLILEKLGQQRQYSEYTKKILLKPHLTPSQGKKKDPAHPAIHPTGKKPGAMNKTESQIYDLICRRFISSMAQPYEKENINVEINVSGHLFILKGKRILKKGWSEIYPPYKKDIETILPPLKIGQKLPISRISSYNLYTKPPSRYNPSSLLKLMEERKLGTKSTRTDIIDTLQKRDYIYGNSIKITELGFKLVETLQQQIPKIVSVNMTRKLDNDLEQIQLGKLTYEKVVEESIKYLNSTLKEFKEKEHEIGVRLSDSILNKKQSREILGKCPICNTGQIEIILNKKTGKRFAGCSNYYNGCKKSYPLPQNGVIISTGKSCPYCGAPVIIIQSKNTKLREICIDVSCESKRV